MFRPEPSAAQISAGLARWLRADARDVVRVQRRSSSGRPPAAARSLADGLEGWRRRLRRRRLVALLRRQLLVALAVGAPLELIAWATGTGVPSRALLLAVLALLAFGGIVAALRRPIRFAEVARLLDHDLALAERVGTALEVEPPVSSGGTGLADLPGVVVAEATAAVSRSLDAARAAFRPARAEWGALLGMVAVLAVLVALPAGASAPHRITAAARGGAAATRRGAIQAPTTAARHASTPHAPTSQGSQGHRPPALAFGNASAPAGASRELARGPSAGKPGGGPAPQQLARGGNGELAPQTGAGSGQSGASATAGGRSGAPGGQSSGSGGAARGAQHGSSARGAGSGAGKAASGARPGSLGAANAPGQVGAGSSASGAQGAFRSRHAPAGGESAGRARGSTTQASHPSAPKLGTATSGLPIQSGYTPARGVRPSGKQGSGPAVAGGSGPARAAAPAGGNGVGSGSFPYIPPTPSSATSLVDSLLLSYFSPFSPLLLASW